MPIFSLNERRVELRGTNHYIAWDATLAGSIILENEVNIWFNVVIRADNDQVHIGEATNIQDGSVLHCDPGFPLTVGKRVTIGHKVMLHGCTVGDGALIGIAAVVLNLSVIGKECLVGAGAVVTERKSFADRSVIFGAPAKAVREATDDNINRIRMDTLSYVHRGRQYKADLKRIG